MRKPESTLVKVGIKSLLHVYYCLIALKRTLWNWVLFFFFLPPNSNLLVSPLPPPKTTQKALRRQQDGGLFKSPHYPSYPFLMIPDLASPYLSNGALSPSARTVSKPSKVIQITAKDSLTYSTFYWATGPSVLVALAPVAGWTLPHFLQVAKQGVPPEVLLFVLGR